MKRAADILVEILEAQNVSRVFGVPGESYLSVLDALHDPSISFVNARHEGGAAFMAEAHGKLTGRPGIACVTRGPGATNASIGVHTAMQNSTPMILFIGQIAREMVGREAFQEVNYLKFFDDIAKWVVEIDDAQRMSEILHRAFHVALSDRPGPVVVSLPEDMLDDLIEAPAPLLVAPTSSSMTEAQLGLIQDKLKSAKRPLIVAGGGGWTDYGRDALLQFAEVNRLPVMTSFRCQDVIDNNSDAFVGDAALGKPDYVKKALLECDLMIALNIRFGETFSDGWTWAKPPKYPCDLVHIHSSPKELGKIFQGDVHVQCGPNEAARQLAGIDGCSFKEWRDPLRNAFVSSRKPLKTKGSVNVADVCVILNDLADSDAIFTNGAGNFAIYPGRYIRFSKTRSLIAPQSGAMGCGLAAAIAAQLEYPDRQVICFAGDGDFQMSLNELGTVMQNQLSPIIFVHNNGSYGTIRMHQENTFKGRVSGTDLMNPNFEKIADAYGLNYERLETTQDFEAIFQRATASKAGTIIEMITDPDDIAPGKIIGS
ncbi:MAG: thiamine pyrophosphate-dependent enzyme [Pseudomonadota bacterium]